MVDWLPLKKSNRDRDLVHGLVQLLDRCADESGPGQERDEAGGCSVGENDVDVVSAEPQ